MKRKTFKEVCAAINAGEHKQVENVALRYTGEVVGCKGDQLVVESFGHRFDWPRRHCRSSDRKLNPLGPSSNV